MRSSMSLASLAGLVTLVLLVALAIPLGTWAQGTPAFPPPTPQELEQALKFFQDAQKAVNRGGAFLVDASIFGTPITPVTKEDAAMGIAELIFLGEIDPKDVPGIVQQLADMTRRNEPRLERDIELLYAELKGLNPPTQPAGSSTVQPAGSSTVYRLKGIEVLRSYPAPLPDEAGYEPGRNSAVLTERQFALAWRVRITPSAYAEPSAETKENRVEGSLYLTEVPTTVQVGTEATFSAKLKGAWNESGYSSPSSHAMKITGSAGGDAWEHTGIVKGIYVHDLPVSQKRVVPELQKGETQWRVPITVEMRAGDYNGIMSVTLVYVPVVRP